MATVQSKHIVHNYVQKPRIIEQTLFGRGQKPSGMRHLFATVQQAKPYGVPGHFTIFLYLICEWTSHSKSIAAAQIIFKNSSFNSEAMKLCIKTLIYFLNFHIFFNQITQLTTYIKLYSNTQTRSSICVQKRILHKG